MFWDALQSGVFTEYSEGLGAPNLPEISAYLYQTTRRHIPEDNTVYSHRRKNLKLEKNAWSCTSSAPHTTSWRAAYLSTGTVSPFFFFIFAVFQYSTRDVKLSIQATCLGHRLSHTTFHCNKLGNIINQKACHAVSTRGFSCVPSVPSDLPPFYTNT
jgi:hypothetical protein